MSNFAVFSLTLAIIWAAGAIREGLMAIALALADRGGQP